MPNKRRQEWHAHCVADKLFAGDFYGVDVGDGGVVEGVGVEAAGAFGDDVEGDVCETEEKVSKRE